MTCNCKKCKIIFDITSIALLAILLVLNCILLCNNSKPNARDLEIMKVGGKENWNLIKQYYTSEDYIKGQADSINETLSQIENMNNENNETNSDVDIKSIVEDILVSTPVRGDKDARFTIVEYTELHCPYCQTHSQNGTIDTILAEYPGEVNSVSKHFIIHGNDALQLAAAMECIAELKGDVYYDAFEQAFDSYPIAMDGLVDIAINLGVNEKDLRNCIDEGRYLQAVEDMMDQGRTVFGVKGTPGNVIIDRETGKYQVLPGAYPSSNFEKIINEMKAN